ARREVTIPGGPRIERIRRPEPEELRGREAVARGEAVSLLRPRPEHRVHEPRLVELGEHAVVEVAVLLLVLLAEIASLVAIVFKAPIALASLPCFRQHV